MWLTKSGEPPGHPEHNIGYDHDVVDICPECSGATLERLKHDCFDFEDVWDQYEWYELDAADGPAIREVAAQCPDPLNPFCRCQTHKSLALSMRHLPASGWSTVFDDAGHRHRVSIVRGASPRFEHIGPLTWSADTAAAQVKAMQPSSLRALFIVCPIVLAISLVVWFRNVHVSWPFDVLVTLIELPATFFVAVILVALARVIAGKEPPGANR
jgi:hypothetical protein